MSDAGWAAAFPKMEISFKGKRENVDEYIPRGTGGDNGFGNLERRRDARADGRNG